MNKEYELIPKKNIKRSFPILFILLGLILLLLSFVTSAQNKPDFDSTFKRPNILWITCEDMSLHLSCFGEKLIKTPNLDALANDGVMYTNAYTVAGVCAPSRCGIITGMYPMSIGGDNMRNFQPGKRGNEEVTSRIFPSYSIVPPSYVKCFPEFLRSEMYYCTNNPKEDYQFEAPLTVWDESGKKAHWKNRPPGKPFFAVFNLGVTHESQLWIRDSLPLLVDINKINVPPYYPDVPEVRKGIARQLTNVIEMDRQAGLLIQELKDAGLYDNTIIFFFSDHGDGLPYVKREITKRGLHIPLIIKFPNQKNAGMLDNQLISAIDLAPTVLSITNIQIPSYMQGRAFLGAQRNQIRKYIYAARDRMDEQVDRVRTVFDGRFQYLINYMPDKPYYQDLSYRLQIPMMRKIIEMRDSGKLNSTEMRWFNSKVSSEELYDLENDPYELNNLALNPNFKTKYNELKMQYTDWVKTVGDKHTKSELQLRNEMWDNATDAPTTAKPDLIKLKDGYKINCLTQGASIGYIIIPENVLNKSGNISWKVYNNENVDLKKGDRILVRCQRIGFSASELCFLVEDKINIVTHEN